MRVVAQANCCNVMRGESLTSRKKQADALCRSRGALNGMAGHVKAGVKREHLARMEKSAYSRDLKSLGGNTMRVRVPLLAPNQKILKYCDEEEMRWTFGTC